MPDTASFFAPQQKVLYLCHMTNTISRTGLVLEGGAMRGLFSAGVMDILLEAGIEFDGAIGVSAGACFGCNYKSRQPGRAIRYNKAFGRDPRYMGLRTLLRTGNLVGPEFAYHELPARLDPFDSGAFNANPMEFWLVATDVATGLPAYYRMDSVTYESLEWMRASASMPVVSRPVKVDDGRLMLDGGIADSIPLRFFQKQGYNRCVVILTQPRDFFKKPAPAWFFRLALRRYPAVAKAMAVRHEMYNSQLRYITAQEQAGNALVIAPRSPLGISRVESDPLKMQAVYDRGRECGASCLPRVREFLQSPTL